MKQKKQTKYNKFITFYNASVDKNITHVVKQYCKKCELEYDDNIRRKYANILQKNNITNNTIKIEKSDVFLNAKQKQITQSKYYIITSAQNATDIHDNFFKNILAYKRKLNAELIITATRYNNTSDTSNKNWWCSNTIPYLTANRQIIHKNLHVLADMKITPTATTPLAGLTDVTKLESCIIGHPRMHLKALPVLEGYPHKLLLTTGMCTVENYTDSKSGIKSNFHHNIGFVIVEIKNDDTFYVRQVVANKKGNFYDLDNRVKNGNIYKSKKRIKTIVFGDVHLGEHDDLAMKTSFEMVERFKPRYTILHDLFSGYSINPHEKTDAFALLDREKYDMLSLGKELKNIYTFLDDHTDTNNFVVVRSNHDEFLDRFLNDNDWRKERSKQEYLEFAYIKLQGFATKGLLPYLIQQHVDGTITLGIDESFKVKNIEYGMHGHKGSGGSRGNAIQFRNLNVNNVTGHTHTPIRLDGHASVGTLSKLRMGFNNGMSNWLHANIIQQPDGNIQHLIIIDGEYSIMDKITS